MEPKVRLQGYGYNPFCSHSSRCLAVLVWQYFEEAFCAPKVRLQGYGYNPFCSHSSHTSLTVLWGGFLCTQSTVARVRLQGLSLSQLSLLWGPFSTVLWGQPTVGLLAPFVVWNEVAEKCTYTRGPRNGAFGKPCLCPRDTRHFRRFTGFEQQSPCLIG